ncbi:MAG: hypothetical protein U0599_25910 [Vicinamibacteria bacterium]
MRRRPGGALHLALGTALAASGCVSAAQISQRTVNYNVAVESARNEMLLLNVIRARERRAMVFTGLTRISGSLRKEAQVGIAGTVGQGMPNNAAVAPSFGVSDAPSFDIAVLDSQEFTRGIMTPITFELVEYFWDQGYPREILLYLGVERVEVDCGQERPLALQNDPTDRTFGAFRALVEAISDDASWADEDTNALVGPPLDASQVSQLPGLVKLAQAHLRLVPTKDGRFQLVRPRDQMLLSLRAADPCPVPGAAGPKPVKLSLYDTRESYAMAGRAPGARAARLVLRSPQSVLFYLGEMARPGREVTMRARAAGQAAAERRLLVVRDADVCGKALVSAEYGGKRWVIPDGRNDCHPGRSLQVLALAEQLLSLQQSAHDLPAAGTVRVIGQ